LKDFDAAIDTGEFGDLHVIYRPHPWRISRRHEDDFFDIDWKHISMDPEMVRVYKRAKDGGVTAEAEDITSRLKHLVELYSAVDMVISPMSSVLLEALLFGIPTMAIAFGDGKHSWSIDKVSQMMHFKELYEIPEVIVCREQSEFVTDFRKLQAQAANPDMADAVKKAAQYFVYRDESSYSDRAAGLVDKMMSRMTAKPDYDSIKLRPGKRYLIDDLLNERLRPAIVGSIKRVTRLAGIKRD